MIFFKEESELKGKDYTFFEFNGVKYFYEREYFNFGNKLFGEKTPKIDSVLDLLEKEYDTKFVVIDIQYANVFGLSTQMVLRNIRYTSLDLPNLEHGNLKCEFIKVPEYKVRLGNTRVNLISNLIQYFKEGGTIFDDKSNEETFKNILLRIKDKEEYEEILSELKNRGIEI